MHASLLTSLAGLAAVGQAAPAAQGGFTVQQVDVGGLVLASGPSALANTYRKFGVNPPTAVANASAAQQSGTVVARPQPFLSSYLSPVRIGTPPKLLMLDFDTGSSDLWVFSSLQPASQSANHSIYNPSASSSSKQLTGETWSITYGDNSGASGTVYADKVNIGGATVVSQAVEAATSVSSSFASNTNTDGLVGLASSSLNTVKPNQAKTFFDNLSPSLPAKLFTASLKRQGPGSYDFGFIDTKKYTGALNYVPIKQGGRGAGFYQFAVSGYGVGSKSYTKALTAIADTGTSLMLLATGVVTNYYAQVPQSQYNTQVAGYIFPCSTTLPSFTINIGSGKQVVPGSDLNYAEVGTINSVPYCYGGLQRNTGLPFSILGDSFLKGVYAVFDVGNQRLGFATQASD